MADLAHRLSAALGERYRVERQVGAGGMAAVFLADDLKHDRRVAIKVLHEDLGATLGPDRFLAEIKTTAKLQHPHILPLLDSGSAGGLLFYVMPFVAGESLRDRLNREKQLSIADAVRTASEIADALGHAHGQGVVHRDIKPENILLQDGHALVADFGIALAVQTAGAGRMTQTGLSLGTPQYMAPEQAMGDKSVDSRADIYALGAVTYEMLVGEPPFTGATVQAIVAKVLTAEPEPPTTMRKTIPSHVENAVLMALAKIPADRFAKATEFSSALGGGPAVMLSRTRTGARQPVHPNRALNLGLVAFGLVAAIGLGYFASSKLTGARAGGAVSRTYIQQPKEEVLPLGTTDFVLSPSGDDFVYVGPGERADAQQLWRKRRDELHAARIPGTEGANSPFFSPDSKWIVFKVSDKLLKVPLAGGAPVTLASGFSILTMRGAWLPDGRIISGGGAGLSIVPSDGGATERLVSAGNGAFNGYNPQSVEVLPGGRLIVVHACPVNCARNTIHVVDIEAKSERQLLAEGRSPVYLPSGHLLYILSNGTVMAAPFDAASATITGAAKPVLEKVGSHLALSTAGSLIYREGEYGVASRMVWVDRSGRVTPMDTSAVSQITSMSFTPDGRKAVISVAGNNSQDLWVRELGGAQSRLTTDPGAHFRPVVSPDGRTVYYVQGDTTFSLMERPLDGRGAPRPVATGGVQAVEAVISRDGRDMLLRAGGSGGRREILHLRRGVDSAARLISTGKYTRMGFTFSPDARFVAYSAFESPDGEVYVSPFPNVDEARWQVTPRGGTQPRWSPNGKEIFYVTNTGEFMAAKVSAGSSLIVTSHERLFEMSGFLQDAGFPMYIPMSGGQRFAMLRPEPFPGQLVVVENWFREIREKLAAK